MILSTVEMTDKINHAIPESTQSTNDTSVNANSRNQIIVYTPFNRFSASCERLMRSRMISVALRLS